MNGASGNAADPATTATDGLVNYARGEQASGLQNAFAFYKREFATGAFGSAAVTTEHNSATTCAVAKANHAASAANGLHQIRGCVIAAGSNRSTGVVDRDIASIAAGPVTSKGERTAGTSDTTTAGTNGLSDNTDAVFASGLDGSTGVVDADVSGITAGIRCAHHQAGVAGASATATASD